MSETQKQYCVWFYYTIFLSLKIYLNYYTPKCIPKIKTNTHHIPQIVSPKHSKHFQKTFPKSFISCHLKLDLWLDKNHKKYFWTSTAHMELHNAINDYLRIMQITWWKCHLRYAYMQTWETQTIKEKLKLKHGRAYKLSIDIFQCLSILPCLGYDCPGSIKFIEKQKEMR